MIVYGEPLRPWIEAVLDKFPDGTQFIGRVVDDKPVAIVGFHSWSGEDIELSVWALPGSGTRGYISILFAYVFGQLKCSRCTVRINADNGASKRLAERLGFVQEGVLRKAKNGKDVLIFGLLKEDFHYGRRRTFTPSGSRSELDHSSRGTS